MFGVLALSPDGLLTRLIQADALTIAFWRGLLYGLVILLFTIVRYRSRLLVRISHFSVHEFAIMVCYGVGSVCFIYSITHTSVANTLFMLSTTPIWAAVFAWLFLGERIPRRTGFAIVMVIVGISIITRGSVGTAGAWTGDLAGLAGAAILAAQFSIIRAARTRDVLPALGFGGIFTALVLSTWVDPGATTNTDLVWLMVMGMIMLPLANAFMFLGPKYLPAPEVGLMMLLETVLGPVWVWLALGENPGVYSIVGGAIVLVTLVVNTLLGIREERRVYAPASPAERRRA
jgi:drug/metabolite transporter (DMT)-like permease